MWSCYKFEHNFWQRNQYLKIPLHIWWWLHSSLTNACNILINAFKKRLKNGGQRVGLGTYEFNDLYICCQISRAYMQYTSPTYSYWIRHTLKLLLNHSLDKVAELKIAISAVSNRVLRDFFLRTAPAPNSFCYPSWEQAPKISAKQLKPYKRILVRFNQAFTKNSQQEMLIVKE